MSARMEDGSVVVEACVTSREEATHCFSLGAGRVELCRALDVGGLTAMDPSLASLLSERDGPVFALIRGNANSFRLTPDEVADLLAETERVAAMGVDGIVVGVLDRLGRVDVTAMTEVVCAARDVPVTFHRAFDEVANPLEGVEHLIDAGVTRVLTSGGAETAWRGRAVLRTLVSAAGTRLSILGGGAVRADHVRDLIEETGLREVHARASAIRGIVQALS